MRTVLRWCGYPLLVVAVVGGGAWAIGGGAAPERVLAVGAVASVLVVAILERLIPYRPAWNVDQGDLGADLCHGFVSNLVLPAVYRAGAVALVAPFAGFGALWPSAAPLLAQLALASVIAESCQYLAHRLAHTTRPLWRLHATHHSPRRLYWLNAGRDHPLGLMLLYLAELLPLLILGAPEAVLVLHTSFSVVVGLLQHCNADLRAGWLNLVFATPELHRWHHVAEAEVGNHNFGSNLVVWDHVFGTWHLPAKELPETIGLDGLPDFPTDYLGQLAVPFRWPRAPARQG